VKGLGGVNYAMFTLFPWYMNVLWVVAILSLLLFPTASISGYLGLGWLLGVVIWLLHTIGSGMNRVQEARNQRTSVK
jgi:hypothetical protein